MRWVLCMWVCGRGWRFWGVRWWVGGGGGGGLYWGGSMESYMAIAVVHLCTETL